MSQVRVDNYANRLGSSSVPADAVLQGTAKMWFNLNGTGTIAERDSYGVASYTDNGVGTWTATLAAARPNVNGAPMLNANLSHTANNGNRSVTPFMASTSTLNVQAGAVNGNEDQAGLYCLLLGDPI